MRKQKSNAAKATGQQENTDFRSAVAVGLHDLQNALWPAAAEVELSLTSGQCPPELVEALNRIGRSVEEAMTIASQMGQQLSRRDVESSLPNEK